MSDFLTELRTKNAERADLWNGYKTDPKEELLFRAVELAGETGELLNAIKKYKRAITNTMGNSETLEEIEANLREEIGDVLICLDRVAECFDEDIEPATRAKFNKTSRKVGLPVLIPEDLV